MRANLATIGLGFMLLSILPAGAQVMIDISRITCDQFVQGKIGEPRTLAAWLSGYYHGKKGATLVDQQAFQESLNTMEVFCRDGKNVNLPVMQAIEKVLAPGK
jgi:acid stress chaperone HdeB